MSTTPAQTGLTLTVGPVAFPAGSVVDHYVVSAVGQLPGNTVTANVPAQSTAGAIPVSLPLPPDSYTVTAVAVDANGDNFGAAVDCTPEPLVVTASTPQPVLLMVPVSLTSP
jgi:hypothetical protein